MAEFNEQSVLMLPRLKENKVKRGEQGKWNRQDAGAFGDVARSIDVVVTTDVANINSIPSMWAYPLALQAILPKTDYNARVRNPLLAKWRGMLAAIALAPDLEAFGKLTAQVIDLTGDKHKNNRFVKSLCRLVPTTESLLFDLSDEPKPVNPWLKGYVFRWNDRPVGMTSPSTIICPAKDADWSGLPWYENGNLESPETYLTNDQKLRLSRWLGNLREKINQSGKGIHNDIANLINDFINSLGGSKQKLDPDKDLVSNEAYFGVPLDIGIIYKALNRPLNNPRGSVFLPPPLYFLKFPNAFPNSDLPDSIKNLKVDSEPISIILPLSPDIFQRPDAEAIVRSLEVEKIESGKVLKLTIQIDGQILSEKYKINPENELKGLPVAEIWPNFVHPNWKIYYGYSFLSIDDKKLSFEFPNIGNPEENTHTFERSKLFRFTSFPNHVICYYDKRLIGTISLKVPSPVNESDTEITVGVDFGTSFTNVYKKQGGEDEKFSFDNLHYPITNSDTATRITSLAEFFIPLIQNLPVASLLTERGARYRVSNKNSSTKSEIIFDTRLFDPQDPTQVTTRKAFLIGDLKWSNLSDKKPIKLFIEQLSLQISAQALKSGISNIQWALSYPTAFSPKDKRSYIKIWNDCSKKLKELTGLKYEDLDAESKKHFRSESLAIGHFFNAKQGKSLVNAACIDIGGGTTDVSIWENRNRILTPVFQFSVRLAGRHLFSDVIKRSPQFLKNIGITEDVFVKSLLELAKSGRDDLFYSALDALLRGRGADWLRDTRPEQEENKALRGYLQILAIGVAGLHYYIGLVLNVLNRPDENKIKIYEGDVPVHLYFGGNGSSLLNWLADTGELDGETGSLFQDMVIKGFKPTPPIRRNVYVSTLPKEEAACGLVVGKRLLGDPTANESALVAGEPCTIGTHPKFKWDDYIQFDAIDGDKQVDENIESLTSVEIENLPQFLYCFQKAVKAKPKGSISIDPLENFSLEDSKDKKSDNPELWSQVNEKLQDMMILEDGSNTASSIRLEPPFIIGLKALIEVLADRWEKKYAK